MLLKNVCIWIFAALIMWLTVQIPAYGVDQIISIPMKDARKNGIDAMEVFAGSVSLNNNVALVLWV